MLKTGNLIVSLITYVFVITGLDKYPEAKTLARIVFDDDRRIGEE